MSAESSIEVRRRTAADLEALAGVLGRVHAVDGYPVNLPPDPVAWLSGPRTRASWVAVTDDDCVIGHVSRSVTEGDQAEALWTGALSCESEDLGVVKRLFVDPDYRAAGVGRRLLETVVADSHRLGLRPVLDVDVGAAPANGLYLRAGFFVVGTMELTWTGLGGVFVAHCYAGPQPERASDLPGR